MSGQDLQESALPAAIGPDERDVFAGMNFARDSGEYLARSVIFAQVGCCQKCHAVAIIPENGRRYRVAVSCLHPIREYNYSQDVMSTG